MKEDVLEQLVDDYLQSQGYFTRHNIKYLPDKQHRHFVTKKDSNHSDIDVIGFNPKIRGSKRVMVVSCKSYHHGFDVDNLLSLLLRTPADRIWKRYRELVVPKWSDGFCKAIVDTTGSSTFTYVTAVVSIRGKKSRWTSCSRFRKALNGNPLEILTIEEMVQAVVKSFEKQKKHTVAVSQLGRTLQLLKAAGYKVEELPSTQNIRK